jgi:hypothetical protein
LGASERGRGQRGVVNFVLGEHGQSICGGVDNSDGAVWGNEIDAAGSGNGRENQGGEGETERPSMLSKTYHLFSRAVPLALELFKRGLIEIEAQERRFN